MPAAAASQPEPDTYAAAAEELESILAELERDQVDVDHLAERVKRAGELIAFCRQRIANAQLHIEQVVAALDPH